MATFNTFKSCENCGRSFRPLRAAKYCSDACRQSAYRKRRNPASGTKESLRKRAERAVQTKREKYVELVCEQCGDFFTRDGLSSVNRLYCSDACKQKAYRERKYKASLIHKCKHCGQMTFHKPTDKDACDFCGKHAGWLLVENSKKPSRPQSPLPLILTHQDYYDATRNYPDGITQEQYDRHIKHIDRRYKHDTLLYTTGFNEDEIETVKDYIEIVGLDRTLETFQNSKVGDTTIRQHINAFFKAMKENYGEPTGR